MPGVPHGAIFLSADPERFAVYGTRWRSPATDAASASTSVKSPFGVADYQQRLAAAQQQGSAGFSVTAADSFERRRGGSAPAGGVPYVASAPSLLQSPPQQEYSFHAGRRVLTSATAYPPWADEDARGGGGGNGGGGGGKGQREGVSGRKRLRTQLDVDVNMDGRHGLHVGGGSPQSARHPSRGSNMRHEYGELTLTLRGCISCAGSGRMALSTAQVNALHVGRLHKTSVLQQHTVHAAFLPVDDELMLTVLLFADDRRW